MGRQAARPLLNRILGGTLDARLAAWRNEGMSYSDIAIAIHEAAGHTVTPETVRVWCRDLDLPAEAAS